MGRRGERRRIERNWVSQLGRMREPESEAAPAGPIIVLFGSENFVVVGGPFAEPQPRSLRDSSRKS